MAEAIPATADQAGAVLPLWTANNNVELQAWVDMHHMVAVAAMKMMMTVTVIMIMIHAAITMMMTISLTAHAAVTTATMIAMKMIAMMDNVTGVTNTAAEP